MQKQQYTSTVEKSYTGNATSVTKNYTWNGNKGTLYTNAVHVNNDKYDLFQYGATGTVGSNAMGMGNTYTNSPKVPNDNKSFYVVLKNGTQVAWSGCIGLVDIDASERVFVWNDCIDEVLYVGSALQSETPSATSNHAGSTIYKTGGSNKHEGVESYTVNAVYLKATIPVGKCLTLKHTTSDTGNMAFNSEAGLNDATTKALIVKTSAEWSNMH